MLPLGIRAQMKEPVSVKLCLTTDAYGAIQLSTTAITRKGRLDYGDKRITSSTGEQIASSIQLYMPEVVGLTVEAEITLPDGTTPRIKSFNRRIWPSGAVHNEVYF